MVAKDNIHLTLVFIGSLSLDRIDGLRKIIGSLRAQRFELDLVRAGCWKRSQIGWLAPETVPTSLDMLVSQLRNSLSGARIHFDDKPFFPHVTLIRKAKCKSKADPPSIRLGWSVDRFSLVPNPWKR